MAMTVCVAHLVIGFCAGLVLPRILAAPILAVSVFFLVASSWSSGYTIWPRHISGQFPVELMYGELPTLHSLAPHVMFTGSIALAAALCTLLRNFTTRIALPLTLALTGTFIPSSMVHDWGPNPKLSTGNVSMSCQGKNPTVCVPQPLSSELPRVQAEAASVFAALSKTGVDFAKPAELQDSIVGGRFSYRSTESTWWLRLTDATNGETLRYSVMRKAIALPCDRPDGEAVQRLTLWASAATDTEGFALQRQQEELVTEVEKQTLRKSRAAVRQIHARSHKDQTTWYQETSEKACSGTSEVGSH
ncbi:hypothetical protein JGS22_001775 [Streptomyces sp. P38-E01]|uniref:DUF7224 domain-containing protein n=1 Tax=Streptomyces tardus TaxID=2780544 RepID=A0A949JD90_9ACTN|nr:hypothetical protein [Streptomyces tardus]MBU7596400.1 hypothetical protein [Streptomyces tardus]